MYTEGGGPNQDKGIVPGHAYSVIAVKSYHGIQLLEIRNPWGEFEWGGAWSDNSSEWTPELIEVFKPNFDSQDGTFWMSYQDFFKYFNAVTICKVNNWDELRLRGKFLRLWENEDPDEDWVLSKFYYSFRLSEQTELNIGLHQEDERCMRGRQKEMAKSGSSHISSKSFYLDLHIIILKRNNNGSITLVHESESDLDREVYTSVTLKPGHYIVIPRTSGGSLNAVESDSSSHYSYHVPYGNGERLHTYMNSIFGDIFSKMDLQLNGQLSAQELNQFGEIIDDDELKSIKMADFFSEKFWNFSCDENGFTKYGFIQYLSQFSDDRIHNMLTKLGYNEDLYSTKSRVFTLSFH